MRVIYCKRDRQMGVRVGYRVEKYLRFYFSFFLLSSRLFTDFYVSFSLNSNELLNGLLEYLSTWPKSQHLGQAWWPMSVIPAFDKRNRKIVSQDSHPGLYNRLAI
jgi:hypothetical protein